MDLMQLEMFVATIEEGNFRRAADRVFRTQPAVSMALKKLQDEIGAPLFERSGRSTSSPSPAGSMLYEYAKKMLRLREEATNALARLAAGDANRIRIGASQAGALYILPALVHGFRQQYPNAGIEIFQNRASQLVQDLKDHTVDLALTSWRPDDADLQAAPLVQSELVIVADASNPLTKRRSVSPADLASHAFIVNTDEPAWQDALAERLKHHHVRLLAGIEATDLESIKEMVRMGLGLTVIPLAAVQGEVERGQLAIVYLEGFAPQHTSWVVSRVADAGRLEIRAARRLVESAVQKLGRNVAGPKEQIGAPLMANR